MENTWKTQKSSVMAPSPKLDYEIDRPIRQFFGSCTLLDKGIDIPRHGSEDRGRWQQPHCNCCGDFPSYGQPP